VTINVHGIGPTDRKLDPGEDQVWVSVAQFEQTLDAVAGRDDVRITFDDGNASDVAIGLPRLIERGLKAEFFVLAGRLGEKGRLDSADVRTLVEAGMPVNSHGWAHRDWRRVSEAEAREEFVDAPRVLGELVGRPVTRVAIPFGSYDRHVLRRLREAGASLVYNSDAVRVRGDEWLQARVSIGPDLDAAWLSRTLDGTPSLARRARGVAVRTVKRLRG
jgi:peptidoglycan/xylan/chitin deacetylase (PgdA/CDA1 family)